ncbi:hypothetical protein AAHA92_32250 [Salvia divinorum]|uniref:Uncharacterized protein n=1 Tax=Salvia divinorum TaxID=28513 RepID=A0ABD1FK64_SALDI
MLISSQHMKGGELRFTLLTHSCSGVMTLYVFNQTLHYCTFTESELEDCTDLDPEMSEFKGNLEKDIPVLYGIFRVDGTLFMVGGYECRAIQPRASPITRWQDIHLRGTAELESWLEIYDPVKGQFEARKLSDEIGYPYPKSCFQWTDQVVLIYYHDWFYSKEEFYRPTCSSGKEKQHRIPSLLSYNMQTDEWAIFAEHLPKPSSPYRNLVYVGGDTLFIIDSTYHWFVYDLSSKKEVGKVKVEGQRKEDEDECAVVMGAVYAGDNVIESTSWVIYIFQPDRDNFDTSLRYSKVEVVQGKGGDYVATVRLSGLIRVGFCSCFYVIADKVSAAEEERRKRKRKRKRSE